MRVRAGFERIVAGALAAQLVSGCSLIFEAQLDADVGVDEDADEIEFDGNTQGPTDCSGGTLVDFEGAGVDGQRLDLLSGVAFRSNWGAYEEGEYGAPSDAATFSSGNAQMERFEFQNGERLLRSIDIYRANTTSDDVEITIADSMGSNPEVTATVGPGHLIEHIETGWSIPSTEIQVFSSGNWSFFIDNICYSAPSP